MYLLLAIPLIVSFTMAYAAEVVPPPIFVKFAGTNILELHYGVGAFSPQDRANAILGRVQTLASNRLFDAGTIAAAEREFATDVVSADLVLVSLTDQDARALKISRVDLANATVNAVKTAIEKDREAKSPRELLISVAYTGVASAALFVLLFFFGKVFPKTTRLIQAAKGTRIKALRIRSLEILTAERITDFLVWLVGFARVVLTISILYVYVPMVLSFFPWTANLAPKIFGFILSPLHKIARVFIDFLPNLFFIIVAVIVTRYILRFIQIFFAEIEKGSLHFSGFYQEWAEPTYKLIRFLVLAFALVVIFPYLPGSGSPAFQGVSVFLGILFSLGSSSAISNVVGGVVLTYMRSFKVGDRVKISDTIGDVVEKTLLITRIRTIKNVDITIPNSMVLGSHIINYSSSAQSTGLILHTTVTIGYDVPWSTVHKLLKEAASNTSDILSEPVPFVLQTSLDDFYVSYELNAYTRQPNRMAAIYSTLHQNIQDAFNSAGVEIMSPHYTSLRDGNDVTIPAQMRPEGYAKPIFEVGLSKALRNVVPDLGKTTSSAEIAGG